MAGSRGPSLPTLTVETGAEEVWLEEVAKALGVAWPLPSSQPGREEMIHGLKARDVHDGLWESTTDCSTTIACEALKGLLVDGFRTWGA